MTRIIFLSCIVVFFSAQATVFASLAEDVHALVKKVDARYLEIQDLQADFTQETQIEGFDSRLASSGQVLLKKPGLLRWDYQKPSIEQILVEGDEVMWYVPEHQQVVQGNLTQMAASKAPLTLLQGAGKLGEQFDIAPSVEKEVGEGGLPIVMLMPKPKDQATSTVTRIHVMIHPKSYLMTQIMLFEKSGNISTLRFSNIRANQGVDASMLKLTMPDDVVVIDSPM